MTFERMQATLYSPTQAHEFLGLVWRTAKPWLLAGHKLHAVVEQATRSTEQNAKLHALLADIAAQKEWAGRKWEPEVWKRLLTAAWLRATGEGVTIIPALDGNGVDVVFRRTSTLTIAECSELIEFIGAWCAQNGVEQ